MIPIHRKVLGFLISLTLLALVLPQCTIMGSGFSQQQSQPEKGIVLFNASAKIKGLKASQICDLSDSDSRPGAIPLTSDTIRNISDQTKPSVVNLYVKTGNPVRAHILYIPVPALPAVRLPGEALGSGFICSQKGFILTNAHVVRNAKELKAKTIGGNEYSLTILAMDHNADLALLSIDTAGTYPATGLAHANRLSEGDWVLAIGNPLGLNHTVSHGIISQKSRSLAELSPRYNEKEEQPHFIQTDTPINPGNSGGPLIDLSGKVVGINTAIIRGAQGISFTVPTERIEIFLDEVSQRVSQNFAVSP
jgi:serine protease Do